MKEAEDKKRELDKLIKKLEPNMVLYGITSNEVEKISQKYADSQAEGNRDLGEEAIAAANIAQKTLSLALSGKPIDLAYFGLYAEQSSKKIRKMVREKNKKNKK